jgi:hypothetical protein
MRAPTHLSDSPSTRPRPSANVVKELKLLFAALGAGGRVVPLGDNSRTLRGLSEYAACLRQDR